MTKRRLSARIFLFCALPLCVTALRATVARADDQPDRTHRIGKKLKCMCGGCNDTAATCYHVGGNFSGPCGVATGMLKEIDQQIDRGDSDDLILQFFTQKYGSVVNIEPPHTGIGRIAWAMPVVYLVVGTLLVFFIIDRWRRRSAAVAFAGAPGEHVSPELLEHARQRVARETED
ncbi:MAG TPA: cytochrome c-type biogenesis protein CcmH [Candidatus Acidoferrum sp.]|jgi:cytochrome c-type biogenesis protein CcmH/NrfF